MSSTPRSLTAASLATPEGSPVDPRVRRTRRALQDALAALVVEGASVTMSAVAQRSGFSRQVLHTHYGSIEQLATEVLTRRMLEGAGHDAVLNQEVATQALTEVVRRNGLAPLLQFVRQDRDAFVALRELAHGQTTVVIARVFAGLARDLGGVTATAPDVGGDAALFVAGGMTTATDAWLRADQPVPASVQAARMLSFARAVFAADGEADQNGPER